MEVDLGCPQVPSEHEICGRRKEFVLTGGVVLDPIEELGAGSLHELPRGGSGPAGPDLVRGGIAVRTWGWKKRDRKAKKEAVQKVQKPCTLHHKTNPISALLKLFQSSAPGNNSYHQSPGKGERNSLKESRVNDPGGCSSHQILLR